MEMEMPIHPGTIQRLVEPEQADQAGWQAGQADR